MPPEIHTLHLMNRIEILYHIPTEKTRSCMKFFSRCSNYGRGGLMDGGFFCVPDAWEFMLPAGVRHLRNAMGSLPKAVGSVDADADGLCAAAGACGGDSGDPAAAGGLPQKRSPGGNGGDLRAVPSGEHHLFQPAGAGVVRPADAAAAVRRRIGATGISPAGG